MSIATTVKKTPLIVALIFLMEIVADPHSCSAAEPENPQTSAKRSGSTAPASTQAHPASVNSGKTPRTNSAAQSKTTKSKAKGHKSTKPTKKTRVRGQREIEPSRVMEIQQALRTAGYYQGEPTGKWDASTTQAITAYQTDNGYKVTGKPDALSLKKLGL